MSTKIYNGCFFKTSSISQLHYYIMEWRKQVRLLAKKERLDLARRLVVTAIDDHAIKGKDLPTHPLMEVMLEIETRGRDIEKTGRRDPAFDFGFDIAILPHDEFLYGIVYCDRPEWVNTFFSQYWVREFSYWDNTDQPNEVSPEEWTRRKRTWNAIFAECDVPGERGFSANCSPTIFSEASDVDVILASLPTKTARATRIAKDLVKTAYADAHYPDRHTDGGFGWLFAATDWLHTTNGKRAVGVAVEGIIPRLPELTKERLRGW